MRQLKTNSLIIGMIGSILGGCGGSTAIEEKALPTSEHKMQARAMGSAEALPSCAPGYALVGRDHYNSGEVSSEASNNYTANWWTNVEPVGNSGAAGSGQPWTLNGA